MFSNESIFLFTASFFCLVKSDIELFIESLVRSLYSSAQDFLFGILEGFCFFVEILILFMFSHLFIVFLIFCCLYVLVVY